METKAKETRVYVITADQFEGCNVNSVDEISNEDFITMAEENGQIYSLNGFVQQWNEDTLSFPHPDYTYIRILDVEQP